MSDPATAAQALLQNPQFLQLFQRALGDHGDGDSGQAQNLLKDMPPEGDPKREVWLRDLQERLQKETMLEAKKELEQVHSDEHGQWMYVLPEPGFCIKCTVGGAAKVFINVCQHSRIGEPVPMAAPAGGPTDEVQFRIPLSCGQARPEKDKSGKPCKAYDVIVNPATIKRCGEDHEFRRFVAALCMQWIKQKSEPTLNADEFRNLNFKAKGSLEPQRIRLTTAQKEKNALGDEIRLPTVSGASPPTQVGGTGGTGKLIEELSSSGGANAQAATGSAVAQGVEEHVVLASEAAAGTERGKAEGGGMGGHTPSPSHPAVLRLEKTGVYDWSAHKRPAQNTFFKESVPSVYFVELYIPNIQTIREVDVRVSSKRLDCYYIDDDDEVADEGNGGKSVAPFLSVVFDYPVSEEISDAKFIRKKSRLRMCFTVQLPDETAEPRTQASRDAVEVEEEESRRERERREQAWAAQRAKELVHEREEALVMEERKSYVENLAAVQSGDLPPLLRDEVDAMPKEQLPPMLLRLEGKDRRGDSIDTLLDTLPEPVLGALCAHIREKLSLAQRGTAHSTAGEHTQKKKVHFAEEGKAAAQVVAAGTTAAKTAAEAEATEEESCVMEYNYAKKSEKLFGVAFHNRYLFALDS